MTENLRGIGSAISKYERSIAVAEHDIAELEAKKSRDRDRFQASDSRYSQYQSKWDVKIAAKRESLERRKAKLAEYTRDRQNEGVDLQKAKAAAPKHYRTDLINAGRDPRTTPVVQEKPVVTQSLQPGVYGSTAGFVVVTKGKAPRTAGELLPQLQARDSVFSYKQRSTNAPLPTRETGEAYLARTGKANYQEDTGKLFKVENASATYDQRGAVRAGNSSPAVVSGNTPLNQILTKKGQKAYWSTLGKSLIKPIRGFNKINQYRLGGVDSVPRQYLWNSVRGKPTTTPSWFFSPHKDTDIQSSYVVAGAAATGGLAPAAMPVIEAAGVGYGGYSLVKNPSVEQAAESTLLVAPAGPRVVQSARNVYVAGSAKFNFVPLSKVTTQEVISGKATFPMAKSAEESFASFMAAKNPQTGGIRVTTATNAIVTNERGLPFTGKFTARRGGNPSDPALGKQFSGTSGNLARETEGLYVTPADKTSIYFTRAGTEKVQYSLLPSKSNLFSAPKIITAEAMSIERVPASIVRREGLGFARSNKYIMEQSGSGKVFLTPRSEKGFMGLPGQTTEIEAVFPVGTKFSKSGTIGYTRINNVNVPLIEYSVVRGTTKFAAVTTEKFAGLSAKASASTSRALGMSSRRSFVGDLSYGSYARGASRALPSYSSQSHAGSSMANSVSRGLSRSAIPKAYSSVSVQRSLSSPLRYSSGVSRSGGSGVSYAPAMSASVVRSSSRSRSYGLSSPRVTYVDESIVSPFRRNERPNGGVSRRKKRKSDAISWFAVPLSDPANQAITTSFTRQLRARSPGRERLAEFKASRAVGTDFFPTVEQRSIGRRWRWGLSL